MAASSKTPSVLDISPYMSWNTAFPTPCECGYNRSKRSPLHHSQSVCKQLGFRNHRNFPPFLDLSHEKEIDLDYYKENPRTFVYTPIRHWCLLAEVLEVSTMFRIRLQVRTRYGERFMIHFHLDKDDQP